MTDIIIVGGGPAGMTAALYARRNNKTVLVLEKNGFGGQITYSPKVENIPGNLQISGNEFAEKFLDQILAQGAEIDFAAVTSLEKSAEGFTVHTDGGDFESRAVILATGVKHRMLGLEGENELVGQGISFCAVCDGEFYRDRTVVVAGGGNSALQEAILLTENCKEVVMVQDLDFLTGEKKSQDVLFSRPNVKAITGTTLKALRVEDGKLTGVVTEKTATGERSTIPCDGLFVAIGLIPENGAFAELAALNDWGYFDSGEDCLTQTEGLFVAGDCRSKSLRQVVTASADGAMAAVAACRYLE